LEIEDWKSNRGPGVVPIINQQFSINNLQSQENANGVAKSDGTYHRSASRALASKDTIENGRWTRGEFLR
jgi:hypothetical protein